MDKFCTNCHGRGKLDDPPWGIVTCLECRGTGLAIPKFELPKPTERQDLFDKFAVHRIDGSDQEGGKHHGCRYFVLDVDHDPYAKAALTSYASACESAHPILAQDLREKWGAEPKEGDNV